MLYFNYLTFLRKKRAGILFQGFLGLLWWKQWNENYFLAMFLLWWILLYGFLRSYKDSMIFLKRYECSKIFSIKPTTNKNCVINFKNKVLPRNAYPRTYKFWEGPSSWWYSNILFLIWRSVGRCVDIRKKPKKVWFFPLIDFSNEVIFKSEIW